MTQIINSYKDKLTFGKHKGKLFEQVLADNSQYIKWALDEKVLDIQNEEIKKVVNVAIVHDYHCRQMDEDDDWEKQEEFYWRDMPY